MSDRPLQLQKQLDGLAPQDRLIIEMMACIGDRLTPTDWFNIFNNVPLIPAHQKNGVDGVEPALARLRQKGLLTLEATKYQCTPLLEPLEARRAKQNGRFPIWLEALQKAQIDRSGLRISIQGRLHQAFYSGDFTQAATLRFEILKHSQDRITDPWVALATPFDPGFMAELPGSIRMELANALFEDDLVHLGNQKAFRAWVLSLKDAGNLAAIQAAYDLMDDRLTAARLHVAELNMEKLPVLGPSLKGSLATLEGRFDDAIAAFQGALTAYRKLTRKRNGALPGFGDCFFCLALMGRKGSGDMNTIRERLEILEKYPTQDMRRVAGLLLEEKLGAIFGLAQDPKTPSHPNPQILRHPFIQLILILQDVWLGKLPMAKDIKGILENLQGRPFGSLTRCIEAIANHQPHPLRGTVAATSDWERALTAMLAMGQSTKAQKPESLAPTRLAWRVLHLSHSPEIEAYEQRRDAKGHWQKGRKLALKTLYHQSDQFDFLIPQDKAVLACTIQDTRTNAYKIHWSRGLCALLGHPHILWTEDYNELGRPVELVKGQISLRLLASEKFFTLKLEPSFQDQTVILEREGLQRVRLTQIEDHHRKLKGLIGPGLKIPVSAKNRVMEAMSAIAPLVGVQSDVGVDAKRAEDAGLERIPGDPRLHVELESAGEGLKVHLTVRPLKDGPQLRPGKGGASLVVEHKGKSVLVCRELSLEVARRNELLEACPCLKDEGHDVWILPSLDLGLDLLLQLEALRSHIQINWSKGHALQAPIKAELKALNLNIQGKGDWFEASGELQLDGENRLELQRLIGLLNAGSSPYLPLGEGRFLKLSHDLEKRMQDLACVGQTSKHGLKLHRSALLMLESSGTLDHALPLSTDHAFKATLQKNQNVLRLQPNLPPTFQGELRPYQMDGFVWMSRLASAGLGACLADDMGLGKTIQSLAMLVFRAEHGPALVVAPVSVCGNWEREARRFAPTLNVLRYGEGDRDQILKQAGPMDLVLCTYGLLQQDQARFEGKRFATILLDEAQAIKNANTKRSRAALSLQGDFRLITTGTPVENHLLELHNLFQFLNPGLFGSQEHFQARFQHPIERSQDPEALQRLKRLIRPFLLRRLKSEVLEDLPEKTEITLEVEGSQDEHLLLEAIRNQALNQLQGGALEKQSFQILAALMKLRRACCHPQLVDPGLKLSSSKLQAFLELQEELRENRHRALVFSQFVDHLAILRKALDERNVSYQYLDGSTSAKAREKAIASFQKGEGDLFLISLKAGGSGLNLTAADYVIHMDPWWNPAVEDQASDRVHRIGQIRPVTIYRLVLKNSIEQKITELHRHKRRLADQLLEGTQAAESLDVESLMALLREDTTEA